jgi:phage N-6-adenine-methyltransferase
MMIKSSKKFKQEDCWRTPPAIINAVREHMGIGVDCAADSDNKVDDRFFSEQNSFLQASYAYLRMVTKDWPAWCNPPFSKAEEFFNHIAKSGMRCVAIYKATNMQSKVWQEIILPNATNVFVLKGRTAFIEPNSKKPMPNPPFNSAIITFNCEYTVPREVLEGNLLRGGVGGEGGS